MNKKVLKNVIKVLMTFIVLVNLSGILVAQTFNLNTEELNSKFLQEKRIIQKELGASNIDFRAFMNFYQQHADSEEYAFINMVGTSKITQKNIDKYLDKYKAEYINLYKNLEKIKKEFPSTYTEYSSFKKSHGPDTVCNPACNNVDLSNGTLSGWYAYYGINSSDTLTRGTQYGPPQFYITGINGGACGSVTQAAGPDPGTGNDYQIKLMTGASTDALIPSIPVVSPYGGNYSVRLGDTTFPNRGVAIFSQRFNVTPTNKVLTYQYAVVLDNPNSGPGNPPHTYYQQPIFNVTMLDQNGDTIKGCGNYNVASGGAAANGFQTLMWTNPYNNNLVDSVEYKNWSFVYVPLEKYVGQCITIQFTCADCSLGGHFGYAYVEAQCGALGLITTSPAFCGQSTITLTGPIGGSHYFWTGPTKGIVSPSDTTRIIKVDSSGVYRLVITPFTGSGCNDTLYDTVPVIPGPQPVPLFKADTVCSGTPTTFTNLSTPGPGSGATFKWDFTSAGVINDSASTLHTSWIYPAGGTYSVTLYEVNKGCGADTTIVIKVDSAVRTSFYPANTCLGDSVNFINTTKGGVSYKWEFGDGTTSSKVSPSHLYTGGPGPYFVTLIGTSACGSVDSTKDTITLTTKPTITITNNGSDTICQGSSVTLRATSSVFFGVTYTWQPGSIVGRRITVTPSVTTTYTVYGSGTCGGDTTIVITVLPTPTVSIVIKPDTICLGQTDTIIGKSTSSLVWSTGQTTDTIVVSPSRDTTYILTSANGKCVAKDTAHVNVLSANNIVVKAVPSDTICLGDSTQLQASGGTSFLWSTTATTSSIYVKPDTITTYTVTITSKCFAPQIRTITVYAYPTPVATISVMADTICSGTVDTLKALGGINGVTKYTWSNGATTSTIVVGAPLGNSNFRVTESNGRCINRSARVTINIQNGTRPSIGIHRDSICAGSTDTLFATGVGGFTWSTGATTSSIVVTPSSTTTYSVTVGKTFCHGDTTMSTVLFVTPIPVPVITASPDSVCAGTPDVLSVGGTPATGTKFTWSPGGSTSTSITVVPKGDSLFTLTETTNGCSNSVSKLVKVISVPIISFSGNTVVCANEDVTLTASPGGTSYTWLNEGNATGTTLTFKPAGTGYGYVAVTTTSGCPDTARYFITVNNVKNVIACCNDTVSYGSSVKITASGVSSYSWNPEGTVTCSTCPITTATPTANTVYTVTGTDSNGCKSTATITIIIECHDYQVPNVFTPNNDGFNDLLVIHAEHEPAYSIEIFDRWGAKVFKSTNPTDYWNGKINNSGADAADGVYYYIIKSSCASEDYNKHGFVQLIRN